jgi:phosphatidylglycerophosphate synthase
MLVRAGMTPNQISVAGVLFAAIGGALFFLAGSSTSQPAFYLAGAAACIPLRLLCNMLDGMVAVEGGKQSKTGALFNELPDRFADCLFLVLAGFAARQGELGIELGWAAALLAVLTAYIRAFGASQGLKQDFSGPMAKPHRMWVLAITSLVGALESASGWPPQAITIGLAVIVIGSMITCLRRILHLHKALEQG